MSKDGKQGGLDALLGGSFGDFIKNDLPDVIKAGKDVVEILNGGDKPSDGGEVEVDKVGGASGVNNPKGFFFSPFTLFWNPFSKEDFNTPSAWGISKGILTVIGLIAVILLIRSLWGKSKKW